MLRICGMHLCSAPWANIVSPCAAVTAESLLGYVSTNFARLAAEIFKIMPQILDVGPFYSISGCMFRVIVCWKVNFHPSLKSSVASNRFSSRVSPIRFPINSDRLPFPC
ncbi:hypothetical protein CHARACLAT_017790 [Characodon lateralis]|uniref:Secreted protein n=1 Tax=Characodon lateralis TaxID=208331 RepID=A0ABU7DVJ3_9TELE|nr:hypothetical protein [Characodon lateralis]